MNARILVSMAALAALAAGGCASAVDRAVQQDAAVAAALAPSLVRVEYTLRFDKGEEPQSAGWTRGGCPVTRRSSLPVGAAVKDERPLEVGGFLVGPTKVVTTDAMIHPRFIEGIAVRHEGDLVPARPVAWAKAQNAVILELERPLQGARPLGFTAARPPYLAVFYEQSNGAWAVSVGALPLEVSVGEGGRRFMAGPLQALITDEKGTPVGLSMNPELPADASWQGSPLAWPAYTGEERQETLADLQRRCERGLVRATLHFRSPKKDAGMRYRSGDDEESATERHALGLVLGGGRLLILANLKPDVTARLERIVAHPAEGDPVPAAFAGSLTDYGCLVATLEKPLGEAVALAPGPMTDLRYALLPAAEVRLRGENRTTYYDHRRLVGFSVGWRRQVYPQTAGRDEDLLLFDPQGVLLALPVARREKVATERRWSSEDRPVLTPACYLAGVLDHLAANTDPHNVPLTEAEERRLAWLGVILQPLSRDLARANKVAEQTRDGETGALVSYLYPDSPAARAGIEPGDILLRLRVEGRPEPLEVQLRDYEDRGPFPWDRLDEVAEQYYDRIPPPWEPAENSFTRALTDLGFGKKFEAEVVHDGRILLKPFEVTPSPPHYDSAPRAKVEALGLTVRDLTYEVRRYFHKEEGEPGVIVSRIEPGSKASVAGIKPFEIITHVNDRPVGGVKDFEAAVSKAEGELRLSVKRMAQGRVVKINMAAPLPKSPATPPEKSEPEGDPGP